MPKPRSSIPSREFLENLIDAVREPLVVLDQDLRVLSVSRAFYEVFRVKPNHTIGKLIYELGDRQWDIPSLRRLLEDILPRHSTFDDYEVSQTFSGLGPRIMALNARRIRRALGQKKIILLAIEDVTARKVREATQIQAYQDASRRKVAQGARPFAQSIIDTVREPLLALDQDLRIVAVSRAFYEVFQVKADETIGHSIYELGDHQWDIPQLRDLLETLLLQATTFNDYEVSHEFATIGRRTMLLNARQVKGTFGVNRLLLLAIEDITARRQAEADREKSQRVESLGVLAGGIAHDFNNLMAGVLANLELVRVNLVAGNPVAALERLDRTTPIFQRGRALTRRLLTFSKGGAPQRTLNALGPHLRGWVEFALVGSDLKAEVDIAPDLWTCHCDIGQIGQVVSNLLINARQASPAGGTIRVKAANAPHLGVYLTILVQNTGTPIAPEIIERIFDPFFTTKSEGSGLGLAIAFSILRRHNGWIDVVSNPEAGTCMTVALPASMDDQPQGGPVARPAPYRGEGIAVIMDDDADIREATGALLGQLGFEVLTAPDGERVLEIFRELGRQGRVAGVFLLDNLIPGGMGGPITASRLRQLGCLARIVLMSGYFHTAMDGSSVDEGALFHIAKPFDLDELSRVLSMVDGRP